MMLIIKKSTGQTYDNNSSHDKPNPTKVIVPEAKELYDMRIDFLAKERYSNKKVFALKDITKERCTNNEEYLLYDAQSTPTLYVKYAECQKDHGITLDWADIVDQASSDDISVFESFKEFIFPKRVSEGIEINPLFKNLLNSKTFK